MSNLQTEVQDNLQAHLHLDHGRSPGAYTAANKSILAERLQYGFRSATEFVDLTWSLDHPEGRIRRFVRRGISHTLGFDIIHAFHNRDIMNSADIVWARTEHEGLAVAALKRVGLVRGPKIIGGAVWLWDGWPRNRARRFAYRWLLGAIDLHATESVENLLVARRELKRPVALIPYGIGSTPAPDVPQKAGIASGGPTIVAPGNDRHRDWQLIIAAVGSIPGARLIILSQRAVARRAAKGHAHVQVKAVTSRRELFEHYAQADAIAVALRHNLHSSGISVAFESLVANKPLAITDTGGLRMYLGHDVAWAKEGDVGSMATALREALARKSSPLDIQRIRERGLTLEDNALRYVVASRYLCRVGVEFEQISALAPVRPHLQS